MIVRLTAYHNIIQPEGDLANHINNAVVVSDIHAGCQMGLYPTDMQIALDGGGFYMPSEFQKEMYNVWLYFWNEWVPEATHDEPYVIVINGDALDGRHHNSVTQITQNLADQRTIAATLLRPIISRPECKALYWIRGTEAHVGQSAENEEQLAESLDAEKNPRNGKHSRFTMWLRLGGDDGCLIHFAHHIGTTGRTHYETSAVMAEIGEMYVEAGRWGHNAADVIVRSHRYRYIEVRAPSERGYTIGTVTPGWQGPTPFTRKVAGGRNSEPQIGGLVVRQGDVDLYTRSYVVGMPREAEVIANDTA